MLTPLIYSEFQIPLWIRIFPFSKYSYIKNKIDKVVISRSDEEVEDAWENLGISYKKVRDVLKIIANYCDWKSIKFIPSDKCSCVFMDHDLELGAIVALSEIEESYPEVDFEQLYEWFNPNSDLLDFILFVFGESKNRR